MSGHTPGEWYWKLSDDGQEALIVSDSHGLIAMLEAFMDSDERPRGEADAKLIARAPKMDEAIRFALKLLNEEEVKPVLVAGVLISALEEE